MKSFIFDIGLGILTYLALVHSDYWVLPWAIISYIALQDISVN